MRFYKQQKGFTLVLAMFILLVLGLLGAYMVSISGSQQAIPSFAVQGSRVFHAARSGAEWGIYRVITDDPNGCNNIPMDTTFNPSGSGLTGITVTVNCSRRQETEAGNTVNIYTLTSEAVYGATGSEDYVHREIKVSVSPP
jgi:MSHA biogenesis protein MshP